MKKIAHFLAVALMALFALSAFAGCGGSDALEVFIFAQPSEKEVYDRLVESFTAETGIQVDMTVGGDEYFTSLDTKLGGGAAPDVYYVRPGDVRLRVNTNQIIPLDAYVDESETTAIWEDAISAYKYDGNVNGQGSLYALPKDYSQYALGFNQVLVDACMDKIEPYLYSPDKQGHSSYGLTYEAWQGVNLNVYDDKRSPDSYTTMPGVKIPALPGTVDADGNQTVYTFDEFAALAYLCSMNSPRTVGGNLSWGRKTYYGTQFWEAMCLDSYVWGNGGEWFKESNGTLEYTKLGTDSDKFVEGQQAYMDLAWKWWSVQVGNVNGSGYENFQKGELTFLPVGTWDIVQFNKLDKDLVDYHLMTWPISNEYKDASMADRQDKWFARADTVGYGISTDCKKTDDAVAFLKYLTLNLDIQIELAKAGAQIPNVKQYAETTFLNDPDNIYGYLEKNDRLILLKIAGTNGKKVPTVYTYTSAWRDTYLAACATKLWPYNAADRITVREYATTYTPTAQAKLDAAIELEQRQKK